MKIKYLKMSEMFDTWEEFGMSLKDMLPYKRVLVHYIESKNGSDGEKVAIVWEVRKAHNGERGEHVVNVDGLHIYPRYWEQVNGC